MYTYKRKDQNGFGAIELILVTLLLIVIGATGYFIFKTHTDKTPQNGTFNIKELGIKLSFSDIHGWTYHKMDTGYYPTVEFDYNGYGSGRITRYTSPSTDPSDHAQRHIGKFYYGLSRTRCPCSLIGEQAYDKLNVAFGKVTGN